jgi:hypothetical protein
LFGDRARATLEGKLIFDDQLHEPRAEGNWSWKCKYDSLLQFLPPAKKFLRKRGMLTAALKNLPAHSRGIVDADKEGRSTIQRGRNRGFMAQKVSIAAFKDRLEWTHRRIERVMKDISENGIIPERRKPGRKTIIIQSVMAIVHEKTTENPHSGSKRLGTMMKAAMQRFFPGMPKADTTVSAWTVNMFRKILRYTFQHDYSCLHPIPSRLTRECLSVRPLLMTKLNRFKENMGTERG